MKNNKYSDYKILHFDGKLDSFKNDIITSPVYIRIKPTNICNHGCFFCVYSAGFRPKDKENHIKSGMHSDINEKDTIPTKKLMEILEDLNEIGVKAVTYSGGGEPLLHKDIVKVMQRTLDYNIDLSILTNGQRLNGDKACVLSKAKWVRISMDYSDSTQMINSRNVDDRCFNEVIGNIINFSKIKRKSCELAVNYIIYNGNFHNIYDFSKFLKEIGIENIRYSPMWVPNFYDYHSKIAEDVQRELDKVSALVDDSFAINTTYNIQPNSSHSVNRNYERCYIMQTVPVIAADMCVYTCHNKAYDKTGKIGSIRDMRFKEMWFSDATKNFFRNFNPREVCRHECSNDRKNILINSFLEANVDNFI